MRVLLRFQQGKFCLMADIEKMFHQVLVDKNDHDAVRFIWRNNASEQFLDIQMNELHRFHKVTVTKRGILSYTSSIFDPLGILARIILEPKLIIQTLWRENIYRDKNIPADLEQKFVSWNESSQSWDTIQIPRWCGLRDVTEVQFHIFADTSTFAYDVLTYFKYFEGNDTKCFFIMSK